MSNALSTQMRIRKLSIVSIEVENIDSSWGHGVTHVIAGCCPCLVIVLYLSVFVRFLIGLSHR